MLVYVGRTAATEPRAGAPLGPWLVAGRACHAGGCFCAGISAIETGRFVPSAATALTLAAVFACRVEDLFSLATEQRIQPAWAWQPPHDPCRYWCATVAGRRLLYPVEATNLGAAPHDGMLEQGVLLERSFQDAR